MTLSKQQTNRKNTTVAMLKQQCYAKAAQQQIHTT